MVYFLYAITIIKYMVKFYEENRFEKLEKVLDNTYNSEDISKIVEGLCALGTFSQLTNLYTTKYQKFHETDSKKIINEICRKGSFKEIRQFLESRAYINPDNRLAMILRIVEKGTGTFDELTDFLNDTKISLVEAEKSLIRAKIVELAKKIAEEQEIKPLAEIFTESETGNNEFEYDVFICHVSEDKEDCVTELATALTEKDVKVWYDEFSLKLGDRLREKIDEGLSNSRYGAVVLSPNFFRKEWSKDELEGLLAIEKSGRKVILPVWHNLTVEEVAKYSPILAGRLAAKTEDGIDKVVEDILKALNA